MHTKKLAGLLAIAVAIGAVVYLWGGERRGEAAEAQAADASAEPEAAPQFSDDERRDAVASETPEKPDASASTANAKRVEIAPWEPPKFEYELEVRVFDEADQPGLKEPIFVAPAGYTLNEVGTADLDGRLVVKWLGFEPRMQVDVALSGGEGLRRVDVAAGFTSVALPRRGGLVPGVAKLQVDKAQIDALRLDASAPKRRSVAEELPKAQRDADGRVQFVEPLLYGAQDTAVVIRPENEHVLGVYSSAVDKLHSRVKKSSGAADPEKGLISGRLVDSNGAPVAGAPLVANFVGGGPRPSTVTESDGSFVFRNLQPGDWDLRAGGGDFGRAAARLSVSAGRTTEWSVELERGNELKGRLIDSRKEPLARWKVIAETLGGRDALVDVATTDSEGRFAIPNLPTLPLRLLARRESASQGCEMLVGEQLWPGEHEQPFVLDTSAEGGLGVVVLRITCVEGTPPGASRVRAWREGTGRAAAGLVYAPGQRPSPFPDLTPFERALAVSPLEPGWYSLEVEAAGREPVSVPRVFVAAEQVVELPTLPATLPASLALGDTTSPDGLPVQLEFTHRGATVELHCSASDVSGARGFLRPGDYRIVRTLGTTSLDRWLRAEAGVVTELE
ncbi:MAG: carboxypeptidase regulatory-like domain-containing protein [Planctomycetaceae bacterium]|nr:carboxypeptidase regulatory-like domain-containing protein [Planctomycetaceae bacterium]